MEKGKSPKIDLMWSSNFEGGGLHLNLLEKTNLFFLVVAHFFNHMAYYGKVANPLNLWHDQNDHETKPKSKFSLIAPIMKAVIICHLNLANVI